MSRTTCSKCNEPLDGSHKSWCKACFAAYAKERRQADPERANAYQQAWRKANPDYDAEWLRNRYAKDPEFWNQYHKEWREAHPDLTQRYKRTSNLRRLYGLSIEQFEAMREEQANLCLICSCEMEHTMNPGMNNIHIDHDHATGEVRGLLCGNCNNGLGCFKDNPEFLVSAAAYLMRFQMQRERGQ